MKRRTIIIIAAAAVCVIAACVVLYLTGVIKLPFGDKAEKKQTSTSPAVFYVEYMNTFMLVDNGGTVIGSVQEMPEEIPEVNGISFSNIIVGEQLIPEEEAAYAYARKIIDALKKNELYMREIYISTDLKATLYVNNVRILLGEDNKTEDKIREMRDFYEDFKDLSGTLDLQELSVNNIGYTFKLDKN